MTSYEIDIQLQPSTFNIDLVTPFITVGGGGVTVHNETTGRDALDAHPQGSVTGLVDDLAAKLEDAPIDGIQYARQDGAWSGVEAGGGGGGFTKTVLVDATPIIWNAADGNYAVLTLIGDRTISLPTNLVANQKYKLDVIQDATGDHTLIFGAGFYTNNDGATFPTQSVTAGRMDTYIFFCESATKLRFEGVLLNYPTV